MILIKYYKDLSAAFVIIITLVSLWNDDDNDDYVSDDDDDDFCLLYGHLFPNNLSISTKADWPVQTIST